MTSDSSGMSSDNGMSNASMSNAMSCQDMMDKAHGMNQPSDMSKQKMAMKHMDMAKADMSAGNEKMCRKHMKMAMHDMM